MAAASIHKQYVNTPVSQATKTIFIDTVSARLNQKKRYDLSISESEKIIILVIS